MIFLTALSIFFIIKIPYGSFFALGIMLIPASCFALKPQSYRLEGSHLIIRKNIGTKIVVPLTMIEGYTIVPNLFALKISRTFGNGGLFGYYGMFSTAEYGSLNCQLTRGKNAIIIKTQKGTFALSPADSVRFEEQLKTYVANQAGSVQKIDAQSLQSVTWASPVILAIPIVLYLLTIIVILISYSRMPERIAVHFDAYGNPDRWGPRSSYLISSLIPSTISLLLAIGAFFVVRKTTHNPRLPRFLVIIVCFIQLFSAYMAFNTYWLNIHGHHILPFEYTIAAFVIGLVGLFIYYYKRVVKKSL